LTDLITALLSLNFWSIVLLAVITIAGSSAASALITSSFSSRTASKSFRRDVRGKALDSIGRAYGGYLKYGNRPGEAIDPERDAELAEMSAQMHVAVAAVGDGSLLPASQTFALTGELFAAKNEETSVTELDGLFSDLIAVLAKQIPS
jgi:hypothetical protein